MEFVAAEFGFTCELCDRGFPTRDGLTAHLANGWCPFKQRAERQFESEFEVDRIVDVRGDPAHRWYLVRWVGEWGANQQTWQHSKDLKNSKDKVEAFWEHSSLDRQARIEKEGEVRCGACNKTFKLQSGLKSHLTKKAKSKGGCKMQERSRKGTLAEKEVKRRQQESIQEKCGAVVLDSLTLENVLEFKYLGHLFQADGDIERPITVRANLAKAIFSRLSWVWDSKTLSKALKLRLFNQGIISVLVYGCEAWELNEKIKAKLIGWNSKCLHRITGRSHQEECVSPTFDLVKHVISRRQKWLGHMLRADPELLARRVLLAEIKEHKSQGQDYKEGTLLSEAPAHGSEEELLALCSDRDAWRRWTKRSAEGIEYEKIKIRDLRFRG